MENISAKTIDFKKWMPQQKLATLLGVKIARVNNWVKRGKIDAIILENTDIVLVNKNSIKIKRFATNV